MIGPEESVPENGEAAIISDIMRVMETVVEATCTQRHESPHRKTEFVTAMSIKTFPYTDQKPNSTGINMHRPPKYIVQKSRSYKESRMKAENNLQRMCRSG